MKWPSGLANLTVRQAEGETLPTANRCSSRRRRKRPCPTSPLYRNGWGEELEGRARGNSSRAALFALLGRGRPTSHRDGIRVSRLRCASLVGQRGARPCVVQWDLLVPSQSTEGPRLMGDEVGGGRAYSGANVLSREVCELLLGRALDLKLYGGGGVWGGRSPFPSFEGGGGRPPDRQRGAKSPASDSRWIFPAVWRC